MTTQSDVFTILEVIDGIPYFVKEEIKAIPQFAKVMSRIRKCKGDSDGRKKILNSRELLYVKYMADFTETLYTGFRGKKRHKRAKEDCGLPNNWEPDIVIKAAIDKYKQIQLEYIPTVKLLNALEQGMMLSGDAVDGQLNQMQTAMDTAERLAKALEDVDDADEAKEVMNSMMETSSLVQARVRDFMKMIADIPKALKQIEELKSQVMLEKSGERLKRGGYSKGNREDPKNR